MKISADYPPNYDEICKVFNIRHRKGVIFTYGDTIHIPDRMELPNHLLEHEKTHIEQQKELGPEAWWARYLEDPKFRLEQEIEAYRTQWRVLLETAPRGERRLVLGHLAKDLAGPIYGKVVSKQEARKLITGVAGE